MRYERSTKKVMRSRCIWVGAVVLAACAPSTEPTEGNVDVDALRAAVTTALQARVTPNGEIQPYGGAQLPGELDANEAQEYAQRIVTNYGRLAGVGDIELCGNIYYAESPYEVPADVGLEFNARTIGPLYYATACKGNAPRVLIAFGSYNREAFEDNNRDGVGGQEFLIEAFSPAKIRKVLDLPEQAVMKAFGRFNQRVQRISLLRPAAHEGRFAPKWRIELEGDASVRTDKGRAVVTREILFGRSAVSWGAHSSESRFGVRHNAHPAIDSVAWVQKQGDKPSGSTRVVNITGTLFLEYLEGN